MSWTTRDNETFFKRCEAVASSMQNLREECDRLREIMTDANSDITDTASYSASDSTQLRNAVMIPYLAMFDGEPVSTQNRSGLLAKWLVEHSA